ncbi:UNVERIFIED_CONTAM: hypothetical protein Slati_1676700 [Sesamum latifolium]|uniref:DUF4283 domain-containing protein n=1 Tax=Sesamum latifolium TaxID=2727402 RepID=A0AAW2WVN5_9LAMI
MEENSLLPLSHTTRTTHTHTTQFFTYEHTHNTELCKDFDGDASAKLVYNEANEVDRIKHEETMAKLRRDFNFNEFYALASKVLDHGDVDAMESLSKLKKKWMESLGEEHSNIISSSRVLRPPWWSKKNVASALQEEMEAPNKEMGSPIKEGDLGNQRKNPLPNLNMDGARIVEQKVVADRGVQMEMTAPNKERNLGNGRKVLEDARKMDGHPWQPTPLMNEVKPTPSNVGYFLGKKPFFHHLNEYVRSVWPLVKEVIATVNGFYFFKFKTVVAMEEVIEGGPWLFQGQPIVLQRWEPGMALRKHKHTQVPVWIKLRHLPVEFWTTEGLSMVASGIGRPLYPDAITKACTRLDFARVCIMLDISSKLPKHVVILAPTEEGGEVPCRVDIEYEWLPPKCNACHTLGHRRVIVRILLGPQSSRSRSMCNVGRRRWGLYGAEPKASTCPEPEQPSNSVPQQPSVWMTHRLRLPCIWHRTLTLKWMMNVASWNVRGLNRRDHQVAVADLVGEFSDSSGPGNRIWIAWDSEFIDVDVLDLGTQFIHCRVLIKQLQEHVLVTVTYGANDTISRREL